jgi:type VI protein secretion system component Hcp
VATDIFLELKKGGAPVRGECQDAPFAGMIQLLAFEMQALSLLTQPAGTVLSQGSRRGELQQKEIADFEDAGSDDACSFSVAKEVDLASIDLFANYIDAQNPEKPKPLMQGWVYFRHDGPTAPGGKAKDVSFMVLEFDELFVYDYSLEADAEARRPKEEVRFYFDKYAMTYRAPVMTPSGLILGPPSKIGWDFSAEPPGPYSGTT